MGGYGGGARVSNGRMVLPFRGLVRINGRGLCPVCGKAHATCDSPAQPELLYPPLDTPRALPRRAELRFNAPGPESEPAMGLVQARDLALRRQEDMSAYTADRRLYLNGKGEVVEDKDPAAVTLLVAEGGTVPAERARELGLMSEDQGRERSPRSAETGSFTPHGPGPDDPGAFYDDGTGATPAGNEGLSDVQSPKSADRERHLANPQVLRVTESMAGPLEEGGMPRAASPRSGGQVDGEPAPEPPASQDKAQDGDSMSGEDEQRLREAERERQAAEGAKSDAPAEDKAQAPPEVKGGAASSGGARGGRAGRSPRGGGSR